MAYMYPETNTAENLGEQHMYEAFKTLLPSGFICYHNRKVNMLEFDFAILVPGRGILVCEVKGYKANEIAKVENDYIILKKGARIYSPLKQADKYRFFFSALINDQFGKDIPIFSVVCYPFINEEDFLNNELQTISSRELTILENDINPLLANKVISLLTNGRNQAQKQFSELTLNLILKIRHIFEPREQIERSLGQTESKPKHKKREYYSCICILPDSHTQKDEVIMKMISLWCSGTKVIIITDSQSLMKNISILFDDYIRKYDSNAYERFTLYKSDGVIGNSTFNLELYCLPNTPIKNMVCYDSKLTKEIEELLIMLDEKTSFNLKQYRLEHTQTDQDIMVMAGAGTGKTTTMIARINYLIYCHNLNADTLQDYIFMITFTKEAANNMKRKLKDYLQNYFVLTLDYEALRMSECIENMHIGTIHSLAKCILQHYSVKLGLGNSLSIVSGKYEKDRFLTDTINDYIEKNKYNSSINGLAMYELHNRVSEIMSKLQEKSIDIVRDPINWGKPIKDPYLHMILNTMPKETEQKIREYFNEQNAVRLSDLMIKLKELIDDFSNKLSTEEYPVRYVFIDEFQDTDDVQISLVKKFKELFGFSLFVVGDVKQCIYRFRGATNKAFDVLAPNKTGWVIYELTKNYRTDKFLLNVYDERFCRWGDKKLLEYNNSNRLIGIKDYNKGFPENSFFYREIRWSNEEEKDRRFIVILNKLMEEVRNLPGEQVAILVRENWQVEKIKQLCSHNNIFVETKSGGDLYKLQPIIDLLKLVKALQHYKNPKYLFNLYTTYYVNTPMPKEVLLENKQYTEKLLGIFNNKLNPIPKWKAYVDALKYQPVLKILREIVLELHPWANYANNERIDIAKEDAESFYRHNLDQIFEKLAFEFNSEYLTVSKIEKYLEIMIFTGQKEQSRETLVNDKNSPVICTTIHKAKGLEYYSVVLPYMVTIGTKKHKGNTDIIVVNNEIGYSVTGSNYRTFTNNIYQNFMENEVLERRDEEARVLYVALTRAKRRLVYFDNQEESGTIENPKNWQILLRGEMDA